MRLSELVFDTDYCDDSSNLDLVNEFFETNNEPTTTGRIFKGTGRKGYRERYPYTFGEKNQKDDEFIHYDYNKVIGWSSDRAEKGDFWDLRKYDGVWK